MFRHVPWCELLELLLRLSELLLYGLKAYNTNFTTVPMASTNAVASAIGYQNISLLSLTDFLLSLDLSAINLAISASIFWFSDSVIFYSFLLIKKEMRKSPMG